MTENAFLLKNIKRENLKKYYCIYNLNKMFNLTKKIFQKFLDKNIKKCLKHAYLLSFKACIKNNLSV